MKTKIILDQSWLNGKYNNGEINTKLPYVSVNKPEFFVQGEDAEKIINEIRNIWVKTGSGLSTEEAFNVWIKYYL